jgi:hypothetical protein
MDWTNEAREDIDTYMNKVEAQQRQKEELRESNKTN